MSSILKSLRLVADPTRVRILSLLGQQDLSVAELQEVLAMGQSRISSHLAQLKQTHLIEDRRSGKNVIYALKTQMDEGLAEIFSLVRAAMQEVGEIEQDNAALELTMRKRKDKARVYFDKLAGKFGRQYVPGRSWKALAETMLKLMPPLDIADLGAGEGTFSQLLAQRAKSVVAIDSSEKMVEFGSKVAQENGFKNLEYRLGDIEDPPIEDASVDIAIFSQSLHHAGKPEVALQSAFRILRPGGRVVVLDLLKHHYEDAKDLYADLWLGFSELELSQFLKRSGFVNIDPAVVDREKVSPHFQTLMVIAEKP
ncbi:MAG: metalloregulator ArsR/SmtB family transcription factor [Verrucomicrobiales bacterium]|nr:metalloregulator ArsR/SmtB family transcription factor [Verrucomicrobiales bacterium]